MAARGDVPAALHGLRGQGPDRREHVHDQIRLAAAGRRFWSLTIYNAGDKLLVDNPIGRYKVGSDTQGLVTAADGSITIPLRQAAPDGDAAKNWLPTLSEASLERFEQRLGIPEVGRSKSLREPSVDRREKFAGFRAFAVLSP